MRSLCENSSFFHIIGVPQFGQCSPAIVRYSCAPNSHLTGVHRSGENHTFPSKNAIPQLKKTLFPRAHGPTCLLGFSLY